MSEKPSWVEEREIEYERASRSYQEERDKLQRLKAETRLLADEMGTTSTFLIRKLAEVSILEKELENRRGGLVKLIEKLGEWKD